MVKEMRISKTGILVILMVLSTKSAFSQNSAMVHAGEIYFQKSVNAYAILDQYYINDQTRGTSQFAAQYKATKPQFGRTNFTLIFNDQRSLYTPNPNVANVPENSLLKTANVVYSDLVKRTTIAKKQVFDDDFLITDSIRNIQWKVTDETRDIAGFSCRRANAVVLDSVYVVAFYTDQIVPKAGPESFTGLPGMILGVVLPHEHISWFATKVLLKQVDDYQVQPPKGGKVITYSELYKALIKSPNVKMNGARGPLLIKNYMY